MSNRYKLLQVVLVLSLIWLSATFSYAQDIDLHFSHLNQKQGLRDNGINSFIYKDSRGFVWISSIQGCYRFDGNEVKTYKINKEGLYSENIQSSFF